jgi:hypothetical protein
MRVFEEPIDSQFVYGFDERGNKVAFLIERNIPSPYLPPLLDPIYQAFGTPVIIKGKKNAADDDELTTFDAITIKGGIIDSLFPPGIHAMDLEKIGEIPENGARTIDIKPFEEYTYEYPVELFGERGTLMYSVNQSGGELFSGNLGKLFTIIRLEFDSSQPLEKFVDYYILINKFLAFCVGQRNIRFERIYLSRRIQSGKEAGKYKELGICKVFDSYSDYAESIWHDVLPLRIFDEQIVNMLNLLADIKMAPKLEFLPGSNREKKWRVSYDNIKNLSTSLEFECVKRNLPSKKQEGMNGLKAAIKATINEYCSLNEIDASVKDRTFAQFHRMDISAADQIYELYKDIRNRLGLTEGNHLEDSIAISYQEIQAFVKKRNDISHGNLITEWGTTVKSYQRLCRITYLSILLRAGLSKDQLNNCLEPLGMML